MRNENIWQSISFGLECSFRCVYPCYVNWFCIAKQNTGAETWKALKMKANTFSGGWHWTSEHTQCTQYVYSHQDDRMMSASQRWVECQPDAKADTCKHMHSPPKFSFCLICTIAIELFIFWWLDIRLDWLMLFAVQPKRMNSFISMKIGNALRQDKPTSKHVSIPIVTVLILNITITNIYRN